jgi:hypothetical protein
MAVRHIKTEEEWKALLAEGKIVSLGWRARARGGGEERTQGPPRARAAAAD